MELFGLSYSYFPSAPIEEDLANEPEVSFYEINTFFKVPKRLGETSILLNGLDYTLVSPSITDNTSSEIETRNLHRIGYSVAWIKMLKKNWISMVAFAPTISSSLDSRLSGDDFIFNGYLMFRKQKTDQNGIGFGLLMTSQFGSPIPLPAFSLTKATSRSKLDIFLPQKISYERFVKKFTAGLQLRIDGSQYNTNYASTIATDNEGKIERIRYSKVYLGPIISYRLTKLFLLRSELGVNAGRRFELEDSGGSTIDYSLSEGPFISFGLFFKPELNK